MPGVATSGDGLSDSARWTECITQGLDSSSKDRGHDRANDQQDGHLHASIQSERNRPGAACGNLHSPGVELLVDLPTAPNSSAHRYRSGSPAPRTRPLGGFMGSPGNGFSAGRSSSKNKSRRLTPKRRIGRAFRNGDRSCHDPLGKRQSGKCEFPRDSAVSTHQATTA
jgi:hypothetical protein